MFEEWMEFKTHKYKIQQKGKKMKNRKNFTLIEPKLNMRYEI